MVQDAPASSSSASAAGAPALAAAFLDVPALLERSQPIHRGSYFWYGMGAFFLLVVASSALSAQSEAMAGLVRLVSSLLMIGLVGALTYFTWHAVRTQRAEVQRLAGIEELIQLRRWRQAAETLQQALSSPTRTPQARVQALIFLASVLARYHRFDDAVAVQSHLLENVRLDESTDYALRLGRAMAMLRADHLFDADRAISELRRTTAGEERESGGLALVEIYRDVKTGHPAEAVVMFESRLPAMRDQLGSRVADAHALAARAYDLLGRDAEAAGAWERATLLSPPAELARRYPELAPVHEKYAAAPAPAGAGDSSAAIVEQEPHR